MDYREFQGIELQGKRYKTVSVHDVDKGDFIKVGSRLVEVIEKTMVHDTDGHIKNWTITGEDGRRYDMFDVDLYLKPVNE